MVVDTGCFWEDSTPRYLQRSYGTHLCKLDMATAYGSANGHKPIKNMSFLSRIWSVLDFWAVVSNLFFIYFWIFYNVTSQRSIFDTWPSYVQNPSRCPLPLGPHRLLLWTSQGDADPKPNDELVLALEDEGPPRTPNIIQQKWFQETAILE